MSVHIPTEGTAQPGRKLVHIPWFKATLITGAVAMALSLAVGALMAFQAAHSLRQFGALLHLPNLVAIAAIREVGPGIAATVVSGVAVVLFHLSNGEHEGNATVVSVLVFSGIGTWLCAPIGIMCILVAAMGIGSAYCGLASAQFIEKVLLAVTGADLVSAAASTVVCTAIIVTLLGVSNSVLRRPARRRWLVAKIIGFQMATGIIARVAVGLGDFLFVK